jgi:peptidoglycan/LPS O-acetylase OafA/YrhL
MAATDQREDALEMPNGVDSKEKIAVENGATSTERIDYLDGWRGLAIAFVLLGHFMPIHGFFPGRLGVDVFFVLSGLLMANLLFVKRTPLATFYERRISRVVPAFILFLITMYSIAYYGGKEIDPLEMLSTVTFFRTYYPLAPNIWSELTVPTGHLWSLNIEEHSYVFMSILTLFVFFRKRAGVALLCVGLAAIFITCCYATHKAVAPDLFYIRTECAIACLMISAGYSLVKDRFTRFVTPVMPVVSLALAVCCYCKWFPVNGAPTLFAPFLLSFTVNHLSEAWKPLTRALCYQPLRLLGLSSYSIYLWQQPFYLSAKRGGMYPAVALVLTIIVGKASFYFLENPARRWLNERRYLLWFARCKAQGGAEG